MALVVSPPNDIVSSNPTIELRAALQDFEAALNRDQILLYKTSSTQPSTEGAVLFVATLAAKNQGAHGQFLWKRLCPFLDATRQFTGVVNQFVSSNPSVAGLVWGGIRTTLLVAENAASYFDQVTDLLMKIGTLSPTLTEFGHLYVQHVGLQSALCRYYTIVVRVCTQIVTDLHRHKTSHVLATIFSPFQLEFKPFLEALDRTKQEILLQVSLADSQSRLEQHKIAISELSDHRRSFSRLRSDVKRHNEATMRYREKQLEVRAKTLKDQLRSNLSDINYIKAWRQALQSRIDGTAEWFRLDGSFGTWKASQATAILWCRGTLGVGKTVFVSRIVADLLEQKASNENISFYFCRSDHSASLRARNILGTIARQLVEEKIQTADTEMLERLLTETGTLEIDDILDFTLRNLIDDKTYYIIVDGLDECTGQDSRIVRRTISSLCRRHNGYIKLLYSARPNLEDDQGFGAFPTYKLILNEHTVQDDVDRFIEVAIEKSCQDKKLRLNDVELSAEITQVLKRGSDGMFLWARLFIGDLCACANDHEIKQALRRPPKSLSDLISRILDRIRADSTEPYAEDLLRLCGVARRPMLASEMREALSVQEGQTLLNRDKMPNDMNKIILVCRGLIFVDDVDESLHYVHHSVRTHLFEATQPALGIFEHDSSDLLLGIKCLTYVNFNNFEKRLKKAYQASAARIQPIQFGTTAVSSSVIGKLRTRKLTTEWQGQPKHVQLGELHNQATDILTEQKSHLLQNQAKSQDYHFLKYARQHWIEHLGSLEKEYSSLLWDLFCGLIHQKDTLAIKPWETEEQEAGDGKEGPEPQAFRLLRWAVYNDHAALLSTQLPAKTMAMINELGRLLSHTIPRPDLKRVSKLIAQSWGTHTITQILPQLWEDLWKRLKDAIVQDNHDVVCHLLEFGVNNFTRKRSALEFVASTGSVPIVAHVLSTGPDVNYGHDAIPLESAILTQRPDIVVMLLKAGANPELRLKTSSPLAAAIELPELRIVESLIDAGANVNVHIDNSTPLIRAIQLGSFELVQRLVSAGATIDPEGIVDRKGTSLTPLLAAIEVENLDIARFLLSRGASIDPANKNYRTPLVTAVASGNLEMMRLLLASGADIDNISVPDRGASPLLIAIERGDLAAFDLFISSGANSSRYLKTKYPLLALIRSEEHELLETRIGIIDRLLSMGVDVNGSNGSDTPLIAAIDSGDGALVQKLLRAGADANFGGKTDSPLAAAVRNNDIELFRSFVAAGIYIHQQPTRWGCSILSRAYLDAIAGRTDMFTQLTSMGVVGDLKDATDVLRHAVNAENLDMIRELIRAGVDVNQQTTGGTVLLQATVVGRFKVVKTLLEAGADASIVNHDGEAPLTAASRRGDLGLVKLLLGQKDSLRGRQILEAAYDIARFERHEMIAALLQKASIKSGEMFDWSPITDHDKW